MQPAHLACLVYLYLIYLTVAWWTALTPGRGSEAFLGQKLDLFT